MSQTAVAEKPAEPEVPQIQPLLERYFQAEEYVDRRYRITLPVGVPIENLFMPEFWVNIAPHLRRNPDADRKDQVSATITVVAEDNSFYLRLFVTAVRDAGVTVKVLKQDENGICWLVDPVARASEGTAGYLVRYNVGARGFDVIRKSDSKVVSHARENPTKEDALAWIAAAVKAK
jgi:hypothetical protein